MKIIPTTYTFDASAKTITCPDFTDIEKLALITNLTTGEIIYQFNSPDKGGTLAGNVLTIDYDTTTMSDTDDLQIIIHNTTELAKEETAQSSQENLNAILAYLTALTIRSNTGRLSVDINSLPTLATVTTLGTLTTLTNQLNIGGVNALAQQQAIANLSWNNSLTLDSTLTI